MSIKIGEIYSVYKSKGWDAFRTDIKTSEKEIESAAKRANQNIQGSGVIMAAAAAGMVASIASITAAVVKIGMPFETMVIEAGSAMRATKAEMERLEAAARRAGATTEHTATAAAESLKFLGKAGLSARESMESLSGMLDFKTAIGSIMGLGRATDVITDSMIAMGLETKDLTHLTDLFVGAGNRSSTNAAQIGEAFSKVAGIARVYGMNVETLTATLAIQASAGIKSGIAGRQLKNALAKTSLAAAELGIENKGLVPTIEAVTKAGWGADKVLSVYGKIAMPTVVAIMSKVSGTEKGSFAYMLNEMMHVSDGMGETAIQAGKMRESVENQFKIVTSMIQDIALSIFDDWKPAMLAGIKTTQEFLKENKKAIVEVGSILLPILQRVGQVIQAGAWLGINAFGMLNMKILEFTDDTMRYFIEIEYAAKIAWGGMQTAFGVVVGHMLNTFASFTTGMAAAFKLIGGFDIAGPLDKATMQLRMAAKGTDELTGSLGRALDERKKAIAVHEKIIDEIALENQGYTTTADESRKAAESVLSDIRAKDEASGGHTRKQMADMKAVSERAIIEADERLKADQEFYNKSGMMSAAVRKQKLAEIEESVTLFRLGSSTEIQIQAWKAKEIDKLNKKSLGKTTKQLAAESKAVAVAVKRDLKAREKGVEERLKIEFGWLDKMEASTNKEIKALEKSLGVSRDAYEKYITEKTGLKELSVETEAQLDAEYSELLWKSLQGDTENFTESQKAMVSGKEFSIEELKKYDKAYSAYLAKQEAENKDIRLEFYGTAGNFSQEYYDEEIKRINAHSDALISAGVAAVDAERQKTDAILALDIKKLESTNTFFAGFKLATIKSSQDMMTWADVGQAAFNTIQSSLEQGFGDAFKSLMEGPDTSELEAQLEGLQDEYEALGASITDVNAQIVDTERATQDAIRGARRETMTEFELFQDDKLRYVETIAEAESAVLEENFQLAQSLFVEAQGIASTLQREVQDEMSVAISAISGQFAGLQGNFDDLQISVSGLGEGSETALSKSENIFKSISASAVNFGKDISKINIAAAFGDINKAKSAANNIIKNYDAIFKAGQTSIQDLMGEWDDYQDKIESVNDEIAGISQSTEDKIRELRRGTMDEQEEWNDRRLEFDEEYSNATRELEEGNFEYASELFEKSIGLAEELVTDSVGTLEGNTDLAIGLMESASAGAVTALTSYQTGIGDSMVAVEGAITSTVTALDTVTTTMDGLSVSGTEIVSTLGENTGLAIDLMESAGIGATDALKLEQEALSANMDMIGGEIEGVSNKIGEESDKISLDWGGLWSGMVETVGIEIGNMAAKWAAAKVTQGVMAGADWLWNAATSAEDGAFDIGGTGPGTELPGGGIPIMAHPGESILPAGLTQDLKDAVNYDEWKGKAQDYFGINPEGPPSGIGAAADYSAAGTSLYAAYQAFQDGDNMSAARELSNAFASGFETYAAQNASQVAGGLGQAAGGISSGIGAWQSFENENYVQGTMQALQTLQQGAAAYSAFTASTLNATSTAALAAAESAATSGAGSVSTSLAGTATDVGYGSALWTAVAMLSGDEHMQSTAAATGATIGAAVGSYVPVVGTYAGAVIGGAVGSIYDIEAHRTERFDLADVDQYINDRRGFADGQFGYIPGPTGTGVFAEIHGTYFNAINQQTEAVNGFVAETLSNLPAQYRDTFTSTLADNMPSISSGEDWRVGDAARTVGGVANWNWNQTVGAMQEAVNSVSGAFTPEVSSALSQYLGGSLADTSLTIDPFRTAEKAEFAAWKEEQLQLRGAAQMAGGGAATGGIVQKEDGALNVSVGEGIIPIKGMKWAENVGNTILKQGGVFGGTESRFDSPGMGTPTGGADIFGGDARNAQMSELLLNDQVTRQGRTNEILESHLAESRRTNTILESIINVLLEGDEEKIRTLRAIVNKPPGVTNSDLIPLNTMARTYMAQPRSNYGFG